MKSQKKENESTREIGKRRKQKPHYCNSDDNEYNYINYKYWCMTLSPQNVSTCIILSRNCVMIQMSDILQRNCWELIILHKVQEVLNQVIPHDFHQTHALPSNSRAKWTFSSTFYSPIVCQTSLCIIAKLNLAKGLSIAHSVVLFFSKENCPGTNGPSYYGLNSGAGGCQFLKGKRHWDFPHPQTSNPLLQLRNGFWYAHPAQFSCVREKTNSLVMPFWRLHNFLWDMILLPLWKVAL